LNIALLVPAPFDTVSGGYIYDRRLVQGLRANGHAVRVHELPGRHPHPDAAAIDGARGALAGLPQDWRLVVDGLGLPAFAPLIAELEARGAVGLIHHPTALEHGNPGEVRDALRAAERAIFPRLARLIATSRLTAARLPEDFGADPARIGVVEPGTDPAPRSAGSGNGCSILSIGTLIPRKGHDVLLRTLGTLTDLDWTLTIVGAPRDTTHARGLRALAEELGIAQRVTFAGEVEGAGLDALWRGADVFALASHWEGYGMAVAEALARGLPVAVTAGGALADLVPVEAGVVSPPGDVVSFGKAMRRVIFDTPLRAAMAEAAWQAGQALPRWDDRAATFAAELERA
jgi:glycosyltransferase involved in cell wall biosynthesis